MMKKSNASDVASSADHNAGRGLTALSTTTSGGPAAGGGVLAAIDSSKLAKMATADVLSLSIAVNAELQKRYVI